MEIWKPIPDFEGRYEVSSIGRVRSVPHAVKNGCGERVVPGKILALQKARNGYLLVSLGRKHKHMLVHRLVASAFLPKPDSEVLEVNHKNLNKTDNRVSNLEWTSKHENMQHAHDSGAFDHDVWRKPVRCKDTGMEFNSSYTAAEWVNKTQFQYKGNVAHIASNIRTAIRLNRKAYGFRWTHVEKQPSTTIPKGSTPKRVEMGSPSQRG